MRGISQALLLRSMPPEGPSQTRCWQSRFTMALLAIFAGLALLRAAVGMYGVMLYLAERRTPEVGLRIASGRPPLQVF